MDHVSHKSNCRAPGSFGVKGDSLDAGAGAGFRHEPQPIVSKERLTQCQGVLSRAFCMCQDHESEDLACAISCSLNSCRPLHTSELQDAVIMNAYSQRSERCWRGRSPIEFQTWLAKFGMLFVVDKAGYILFGIAETSYFLRNFRIRGIDGSHRTIAMICLACMELSNQWPVISIPSPFSTYAAQYWEHHCHIAARSSMSLRYEGPPRRSTRSNERQSTVHRPRRSSRSPVRLVRIRVGELDVADEAEGWVSVERD